MIKIINQSTDKLKRKTAQVVIVQHGKSQTKHLVQRDPTRPIYFDSHQIPYNLKLVT